jgi:sulfide:quinone oxidoreductase
MIVPPFAGVDAVREASGLANPAGFIPIDAEFRHPERPEVLAVPAGVPKTGHMTEVMARVAAHNVVADIKRTATRRMPLEELHAVCVLDAANGIIFKADHALARDPGTHPRHARIMAGPHGHWAKLAFERYFLASRRRGLVAV